jgi:osmotically-inducible protein OsmY
MFLSRLKLNQFPLKLIGQAAVMVTLASQLNACVPVVAGGVATAGAMVSDRRSSGTFIDDETIELKAVKAIGDNFGSKDIHANITSYNRHVLITGEVSTEANKAKAESAIKSIDNNIKRVTNDLKVAPNSEVSARVKDSYITSKVKAEFIKRNLFPATYVKVITEAGTVYLMGIVTKKEADDAVNLARNTPDVKQVVKVFEYID